MSIQLNSSTPLYNQVFDNPGTITAVGKNSLKECVYVNSALWLLMLKRRCLDVVTTSKQGSNNVAMTSVPTETVI